MSNASVLSPGPCERCLFILSCFCLQSLYISIIFFSSACSCSRRALEFAANAAGRNNKTAVITVYAVLCTKFSPPPSSGSSQTVALPHLTLALTCCRKRERRRSGRCRQSGAAVCSAQPGTRITRVTRARPFPACVPTNAARSLRFQPGGSYMHTAQTSRPCSPRRA